jgi:arylsulfatase A-like enzyme
MRIKLLVFVGLIFIALLVFMLWPLKSDEYALEWDEAAVKDKNVFLQSIEQPGRHDTLPNIILILVDDLGLFDMSYYGNERLRTPNMDNIAHSGIAFKQAYVASPMCSASRAAILTGRYPQRFGFEFQMHDRYLRNRLEYYWFKYFLSDDVWQARPMTKVPRQEDIDKQGLPPSEISIADLLRNRGYSTAIIGKWHTGMHERNLPSNFGFDYQYGFFDAHTLYTPIGTEGMVDHRIKDDFTDQYNWSLGRSGPRGIYRNYALIDEKDHLTDAITRESISFIEEHAGQPFFLMAAYNAPHTPLQAPESYVSMFDNEKDAVKRVYYAMIKQLDDAIGRLIGKLETSGLIENTLIVFMSDNGGATYTNTTDNGPLRGGKITDFEGGTRVPFFMSWKGRIMPGSVYHSPVISMDVFATIASIANCPLPEDRHIDGKDLLKYIGNDSLSPHRDIFWQRGNSKAVRSGDLKVVWNTLFQDTLLFHITDDPFETKELRQPGRAKSLIELHHEWSAQLETPLWPSIVYFREQVNGRWVYFDN